MSHQLESPPLELVNAYPEFYRWLLPRLNMIAAMFPNWKPTSWWRSVGRNFEVGGDPRSQHLLAWAVDFVGPRDEARGLIALIRSVGLVGVDEGDHVHVQMFPAGVIPDRFFPKRFPF